MLFEHDGIGLRTVVETDIEQLRNHRNEFATWSNLGSAKPLNKAEQSTFLERFNSSFYYLIACRQVKDTELQASVGLVRFSQWDSENQSVCVGVDVFKYMRGRKLSYAIWKTTLEYLFIQRNIHRVWLFVLDSNQVAEHVYKKLGFFHEGTQREAIYRHGQFCNYEMYSMLRSEYV